MNRFFLTARILLLVFQNILLMVKLCPLYKAYRKHQCLPVLSKLTATPKEASWARLIRFKGTQVRHSSLFRHH
jgi:hypothetical protein